MKIEQYNPSTMATTATDITGVDFGNVVKGNYADDVIVVKPVAETETLTALALFLEDNAGLDHTRFGKYANSSGIPGIQPGDDRLSDAFVEVNGISDMTQAAVYSDNGLILNASSPEFTWIDAQVGQNETVYGSKQVNFRFVFEYS